MGQQRTATPGRYHAGHDVITHAPPAEPFFAGATVRFAVPPAKRIGRQEPMRLRSYSTSCLASQVNKYERVLVPDGATLATNQPAR